MDDLISRQAAINLLKKWSDGYDYIETKTESAIKDFQNLPSAQPETIFMKPIVVDFKSIGEALGEAMANKDIIEVVRCEYCTHWNKSDCHSTVVPIARKCMCMNVYTDPDFFCKYGERRENDAEVH